MAKPLQLRRGLYARHQTGVLAATCDHSMHFARPDEVALIQMGICAVFALAFLSFGQREWAGRWVYLVLLVMLGHCVLRRQHARLGALVVGLIPILMLLRSDFLYSLPIVLLAGIIAFWFVVSPRDVAVLWANVGLRLMLIMALGYWLVSFYLTADYTANLRVLELAFSVCSIFLLANSPGHLITALIGVSLSAVAISIGLMPFGDRLGMASIGSHRIGNPISLGIPLVLFATLSIADQGKWLLLGRRVLLRVVLGVTSAALLLLTTSRGSIAVAIVSLSLLLWLGKGQRVLAVCVLVLLASVIPVVLVTQRGVYLEQWFGRTVSADRTLSQVSSGRSDQWLLFPRIFADSPMWGHGPGLGPAEYAKYSALDERIEYMQGQEAEWHSLYLQLGVETGLIGLLGFALFAVPLLLSAVKHMRLTGQIVPLLGVVSFLIVAASVSGMDAISGVFLGLGFLGTRVAIPRSQATPPNCRSRALFLTRKRTKRYLDHLMIVDSGTMGEPWGPEHWLLELPQKWELSWFILRAREPIAFLVASRKESTLHIHRLAVAAHERNKAFGSQLLHVAARQALARGCTSITLKVDLRNEAAIRFYRRLGFKTGGESGKSLTMVAVSREIVERSRTNKQLLVGPNKGKRDQNDLKA